jgi:hypothetical protein
VKRRSGDLLHVVGPLAAGVLFYLALRPRDIVLFAWMQHVGLQSAVDALRHAAAPLRPLVPHVLGGSLPDGAWGYAFGAALGAVWRGARGTPKLAWLALGLAITAFLELGQAVGIVPGVFDVADLLAMVGGFALGAWLRGRRGARVASPAGPEPTALSV